MIDPVLNITIRICLAILFLSSAIGQLRSIGQFKASVSAYNLVPFQLISIVAWLLIFSELIIGCQLLFSSAPLGIQAASTLLLVYFLAMLINLMRGNTNIGCGCSLAYAEAALSYWHLLRNGTLLFLSFVLWFPMHQRTLDGLDSISIILAFLSASILYLAVDTLLANRTHLVVEVN